MPDPTDSPSKGLSPHARHKARQVATWVLAPLLASAAIGLQIALDVPRAPMVEHEAKKPKPRRKSAAARNAERNAKAKAKTKTKTKANNRAPRPRSQRQITQLRERWSAQPLADEPVDQGFRRRHEGLLRSVVSRARAVVLDGAAPPPMQIKAGCHTIRCDLQVCGPAPVIVGIAERLPGVMLLDQPLWHELREVDPIHERPELPTKPDQICRRWIVDFTRDGGNATKLVIPD